MIAIAPRPVQKRKPMAGDTGSPRPLRWTVKEFHDFNEAGLLGENRCFLIQGTIIEEDPMNPPHATAGTLSEELLRALLPAGCYLRVEKPLVLGESTDPRPDAAIIRGNPREATGHPTTAELVLEIADSSLQYDLKVKAPLYAMAAIAEYWVLDLVNRLLVVHREPNPSAGTYSSVTTYTETDRCSPLLNPTVSVLVGEMLPPFVAS